MKHDHDDREHEHYCGHCYGTFKCSMGCTIDIVDGKRLGGTSVCDACENKGVCTGCYALKSEQAAFCPRPFEHDDAGIAPPIDTSSD